MTRRFCRKCYTASATNCCFPNHIPRTANFPPQAMDRPPPIHLRSYTWPLGGLEGQADEPGRPEGACQKCAFGPTNVCNDGSKIPKEHTERDGQGTTMFSLVPGGGGKCKVAWNRVCSPTEQGGLGILDMSKFSGALRMRWLCLEWQSPRRPWVGFDIPCDDQDREAFHGATAISIGDNRTMSFWKSRWIGTEPLQ